MLTPYRRHNPAKCKLTSILQNKCRCPIWVYGTLGNRIVRKTLKLRDWNRAQELVRRWDVEGSEPTKKVRITIEQWRDSFMQDTHSRSLTSETARKYRYLFTAVEAFGTDKGLRFVDEFDLPMLDAFRTSWRDGPLSASKKLERLRGMFKFALARKWVTENPALLLKSPRVKQTPTMPFTPDEMERILKAAKNDPRLYAFIQTMRFSGLRIADVTGLATNNLQGDRLSLYTAKTGEHVSILLPVYVGEALRALPRHNPKYFFWSGQSKLASTVGVMHRWLARVFKKAEIMDGHSHRFRDTFAVSLLETGVSVENVSTLLSHQNIRITQKHYSPWVKSRQDALDFDVAKAHRLYKNGTKMRGS